MQQHTPRAGEGAEIGRKLDQSIMVVNVYFIVLAILAVVVLCLLMTTITLDSTFVIEQCSNKFPRSGETCFFGQIRAIPIQHYATPDTRFYTPPIPLPTPSRTPTAKPAGAKK